MYKEESHMKKGVVFLSILASSFVLISCANKTVTTEQTTTTESVQSSVQQDFKGEIK